VSGAARRLHGDRQSGCDYQAIDAGRLAKTLIDFSLDGTFLIIHAVIPVMKRPRSGKIVNLAPTLRESPLNKGASEIVALCRWHSARGALSQFDNGEGAADMDPEISELCTVIARRGEIERQ
jgi:hypothetical protein